MIPGPDHARRVFASLAGPKRLILVTGGGHSQSLRAEVWVEIESWLDAMLGYTRAKIDAGDTGTVFPPRDDLALGVRVGGDGGFQANAP